ncbi:hypothetical protein QBC34DRAFT_412726 [Podospora aff. communis PSN243]|uniref:Uncharacterized protein n=1 Tax=Podospora aff. communis PSN243 TaxID=3040156 RepID=A0AAV9GBK0_9PEZI|nr:hypothetical protein QBC34DRAFT_412726 [Podospora aff. communis PSN243]
MVNWREHAVISRIFRRQAQQGFSQTEPLGRPKPLDLIPSLDLGDIQDKLRKGAITSEILVRTYQARIAEANSKVRAMGCLNPDALALAV